MYHPSLYIVFGISLVLASIFTAIETCYRSSSRIRFKTHEKIDEKSLEDLEDIFDESDREFLSFSVIIIFFRVMAIVSFVSIIEHLVPKYYIQVSIIALLFIVVIFTDMIPKKIAKFNHEAVYKYTKPVIRPIEKVFLPIVYLFDKLTDGLARLLGAREDYQTPIITQEDLKAMVDVSNKEGLLESHETDMIQNIFLFGGLQVEDVMTQRMDIDAFDINIEFDCLIEKFKQNKFSRLLVYDDTIDTIKGFVYVKDMFYLNINKDNFDIEKIIRPPYYTYEFVKISDLFQSMRNDNKHIAVVLDEYGGVAGLITMEDVIESIVGDIYDEYDQKDEEIVMMTNTTFIVNANAKLEDVKEKTSIEFESEDYDTLGGYIMENLGEVPEKGQILENENFKITVLEMDKNRIGRVKVVKKTARPKKLTDEEISEKKHSFRERLKEKQEERIK